MKTIAGGLLLAVALIAAGMVCLAESRHTQEVADAHLRLATLQYDGATVAEVPATLLTRLPPPLGLGNGAEARHQALVSYWLARYADLTDTSSAGYAAAVDDPQLLLVAANSAFRTSAPQSTDRKAVVGRLDSVIQAYGDVLRRDGSLVDAAYNYEFVTRLRDTVARGPVRGAREPRPQAAPPAVSVDLPSGPTIHGRPGAPPDDMPMGDFKTITPMKYDEREEQTEPGLGQKIRRKG
ncbi:MAG: hypothetical protein AB7Q29_14135 [Vicinamibacterales bacterium]